MANRVKLEKEIKEYCLLNNITDIPGFITQCMLRGFNIFRYGLSPSDNIKRQNGEIIDNGNNKTPKKEKSVIQVKKTETVKPVIEEKFHTSEEKEIKSEITSTSPILRKRRKITITND